jgi:hypothetical protein
LLFSELSISGKVLPHPSVWVYQPLVGGVFCGPTKSCKAGIDITFWSNGYVYHVEY